ncbi:PepSY domain-containing protein [Xanthobacter sp. KR7-225]|uniref:PepSY domain-containing protein n=1 Tax=Xanthobacter sp. KR7-225 TaxID=3156613 RepID=UPI0032B4ADA7
MRRFPLVLAFALVAAGAARAQDRPVTDDERAKVTAALSAHACQPGSIEMDDGLFEVDDAVCADGKRYDFKFKADMTLIEKTRED